MFEDHEHKKSNVQIIGLVVCFVGLLLVGLVWWTTERNSRLELVNSAEVKSSVPSSESYIPLHKENRQQDKQATSADEDTWEYPYPASLAEPRVLTNIRTIFDSNWQLALQGEPESMFKISQVILNCRVIYGYGSLDEYNSSSMVQSGRISENIIEAMLPLFPDCVYVNSVLPSGVTPDQWYSQWLSNAASAGHLIANLDILGRGVPFPEGQENERYEELLEESVRMRNAHGMDHVAIFIANQATRDGVNELNVQLAVHTWQYLACIHNSNCNQNNHLGFLRQEYYEHDIQEMMVAAQRYESRIEDLRPFDFLDVGPLDEMFKTNP